MGGADFRRELRAWKVAQLPCPKQRDSFSCGIQVFLNAAHVIAGREMPDSYSADVIRAARGHIVAALMRGVEMALD